uniref:NCK-interacting protein with SH3 domain-like n=1 Tax=Ciona intestinalis TaxID=7719 RepID=F6W2V1_CIOIN
MLSHNDTTKQTLSHPKHLKKNSQIPGRSRSADAICLEVGCGFVCNRIPQLRTHLEDTHGIIQTVQHFVFANQSDFDIWLAKTEREACCTFMRRRGWQNNKNGSSTACFYCHRGGSYTSSATKKQMKIQGSCKTGVECTASVKVTQWKNEPANTEVHVEAHLQHYGHNFNLEHTRITKLEKEDIARKPSCGVSRYKIMDEVR